MLLTTPREYKAAESIPARCTSSDTGVKLAQGVALSGPCQLTAFLIKLDFFIPSVPIASSWPLKPRWLPAEYWLRGIRGGLDAQRIWFLPAAHKLLVWKPWHRLQVPMGAAWDSFLQGEEAHCDSWLLVLLPRGLECLPRRVCETSLLFSCFCYSSASALLTPISCNFSI